MEIRHIPAIIPGSGTPAAAGAAKECRGAGGAVSAEDACGKDDRSVRAACAEMESLFIYHLLKEMHAGIPKSGLVGGGTAESMYTDMMHQALAGDLAKGGGIGLSDILMAQLAEGRQPDTDDEKGGIGSSGPKAL